MTSNSIKINVKPEVFEWLRTSSGWQIEEVAKKLQTSRNTVLSFEHGTKKPSLRQLEILAQAYHRPLASFLLAEPQLEKPLPKDYRQIPNKTNIFDSKTVLAIRKARYFQEASRELSQNIDEDFTVKLNTTYTIDDDPITLANSFRTRLSFTTEQQKNFTSPYQMFNYLRSEFEKLNIFTFQFSFPIDDARGFALSDEQPMVLVVNSKDHIKARNFTLLHEFAHILLGETAIDLVNWSVESTFKQEKWCSEFASAFLLPKGIAQEIYNTHSTEISDSKILNKISNKYKLSKAMILYNFYKLDLITKEIYNDILNRFHVANNQLESKEGVVTPDKKCLSSLGNKFIGIISENFEQKQINFSEALNYLSIKSKDFDKVILKVSK